MRSTPSSLRPSSRRREVEEPKGARLSANAKILRELIRARQQLLKIEVRIFRRDYLPILRRMEQELLEAVTEIESGRPLNEVSEKRVRDLLRQFSAIVKNAEDSLRDAVGQGVADVAKREVKLQRATVKKIALGVEFNAVPAEQLAAVIDSTTEDLLHPFVKNWGKATLGKAKEEIAIAVGLGEDMDEAANRIAAAISSSKKQALTIARTGIQQAAANAAEAFHKANTDVEKGVGYVAVLDLDTCPICGLDDGKFYSHEPDPKADGLFSEKPELLRHPHCRCAYVPVLKSWRDLGIDIDDAEVASTRASMDGQVPETLAWEDWFEERSEREQKAILGKGVFALWKDGKISTADLKRGNARRTLAQLLQIAEK